MGREEDRRERERDKRKADGHGRNLWWQENRARVIIGRIAIRMDELYRRGLRCVASNAASPRADRATRN